MGCIDLLLACGGTAIEPRREVYDDYYQRCQAELHTLVWSQPSIRHSFYKDARGVVHSLSPWRLVDFWSWTRSPDPTDYLIR
jgi:4-hydroxyacetophenone monooxygenase